MNPTYYTVTRFLWSIALKGDVWFRLTYERTYLAERGLYRDKLVYAEVTSQDHERAHGHKTLVFTQGTADVMPLVRQLRHAEVACGGFQNWIVPLSRLIVAALPEMGIHKHRFAASSGTVAVATAKNGLAKVMAHFEASPGHIAVWEV